MTSNPLHYLIMRSFGAKASKPGEKFVKLRIPFIRINTEFFHNLILFRNGLGRCIGTSYLCRGTMPCRFMSVTF